ncbi:MAG: hypothetical protein BZY88_14695 [SAR202 cluster bacterium Io17-Chloro-G9]|nr:MAG: hypothetical protein BZY88_14695 [SAR202 cluster bacterium Io17-Chloro-G9]
MGILSEDMKRVVRQQRLGFIATVCPDGTPNLSPKGTAAVWDDDHLVFADLASPVTMANLAHNPALEINVVDAFSRKGYRFKGTGAIIACGKLFDELKDAYATGSQCVQKIGISPKAFVMVTVTKAAELVSPAYTPGVEEATIRQQWAAHWASVHETQMRQSSGGN